MPTITIRPTLLALAALGTGISTTAQNHAWDGAMLPTEGPEPVSTTTSSTGLAPQRTPIHTAPADEGSDYGLWAAGATYKASFHGAMTFVPYLGAEYPHNQPLSWRTTSITVGGVELATGHPVREHSDYRCEYRFAGATEAYDVRTGGLEQTFVIAQLPATGDLVVRGAVTTDLVANDVPAAHQPITFCDHDGNAITRYGSAIAIDANGNTIPMTTSYENATITLRAPGSWLATAALPIVVDPLLTRVQVASHAGEVGHVDIGRDDRATSHNVMMAYVRYASSQDGDAFARLMNDDYSGSTQVFYDTSATWSTTHASCALVGGVDMWVVGLSRFFGNASTPYSGIRCHAHASADLVATSSYRVLARPANVSDWRPDVGGVESYQSGDDALVVFQSEDNGGNAFANTNSSQVRAVLFSPALGANGTFGVPFDIRTSAGTDNERPSVNQVAEGGSSFSWVCVMQTYGNAIPGDDWDVYARRIDSSGTLEPNFWASDLNLQASHHQLAPVIEGNNGRYAVLFTTVDLASVPGRTSSPNGKEVRVERLDWPHGASHPDPIDDKAPVILASNGDRRWQGTGLGFDTNDDSHWAATFRSLEPLGLGYGYCQVLGYNGDRVGIWKPLMAGNPQVSPASCVFDNDHNDFLMAYGTDEANDPVYGHTFEYESVPPDIRSGQGCGSTTLTWVGNQQIGSEFNYLRATANAPVGHFVVVALAPHDLPVVHPDVTPGCRLLVDAFGPLALGTLPFQFTQQARYTIALPEWLGPMTLYFQDWVFDGNVLEGSQRLEVPIIK